MLLIDEVIVFYCKVNIHKVFIFKKRHKAFPKTDLQYQVVYRFEKNLAIIQNDQTT